MKNNDEEVLGFIDRLVERLQQAGHTDQGGKIEVVYVASGGQHVETQIIASPGLTPTPSPRGEGNLKWRGGGNTNGREEAFKGDTPLSALFRESHHEELRKVIESWRPYLTNAAPTKDALSLNDFQFAFTEIRPVIIYMDLAHLVNHDALRPPMSVLAAYMFEHSNLSRSENALYVQLKRYRKMCE